MDESDVNRPRDVSTALLQSALTAFRNYELIGGRSGRLADEPADRRSRADRRRFGAAGGRPPVDAQPEDDLDDFHAVEHDQVIESAGHEATATKCADLAVELSRRFADEPTDRLVGALGGRMLTLDDFCRTRLIEVLLHLDDLSVSVGEPRPETDPLGVSIMIDIIGSIARHVHGDWKVIYALARSERVSKTAVFPVF